MNRTVQLLCKLSVVLFLCFTFFANATANGLTSYSSDEIFMISVADESTLESGDIAIIGFNSDTSPDELAIVALASIPAGNQIFISDYGWDGAAFSVSSVADGVITWTTNTTVAAGTVIKISIESDGTPSIGGGLSTYGTVSAIGWTNSNSAVSSGGDNWFIYQGSSATAVPTTWLFGWADWSTNNPGGSPSGTNGWQSAGSVNSTVSYLPAALTNGVNAIALTGSDNHNDNMLYSGTSIGTKATILASIVNVDNWVGDEAVTQDIDPGGTNFTGTNPIYKVTGPNTAPTESANTKASLNYGATHTITQSELEFTDSEQTDPAEIKYTIEVLPSHGMIQVGILKLTIGDEFSQQSINEGSVVYVHDGGSSISDNFQFNVSDGHGGTIDNVTFDFTITCALNASITAQSNLACYGDNTGSVTVQATEGTANYSYVWSNESSTTNTSSVNNTITGLISGVYSVIVTDGNNCKATASTTLLQPANALSAIVSDNTGVSCNGGSDGRATVTPSGGTAPYTYSWSPSGGNAPTVLGLNAGTYTCTITDDNGCVYDKSISIIEPAVIKTTEVISVCESYKWTDGNTYTSTGSYIQNLISKNGCDSIAKLDLTIYPAIEMTSTNTDNVLMAIGNAVSFQWYNCDTKMNIKDSTNATFTISDFGVYAVIGTSLDGCKDTSECVSYDPTLSLDGYSKSEEIYLFPNPTFGKIRVEFSGTNAEIEIYSARGEILGKLSNVQSGDELSLDSEKPGIYFVKINTDSGVWNQQIVKQ